MLNLPGNQVLPGTAFSPQSVSVPANGQATSTLTIVTNSATQTGTASLTIQGINGSTTKTAPASLTVNAAAAPVFTTSPSSGQQLTTTFTYTGTGLTRNGTIQRYYQGAGAAVRATDTAADSNGQVSWTYVYQCTDAPGTWSDWIVDVSKAWTSSHVTNVVSASASCTPSYTVSVSPSTATVTQGGSASYTVTVQSQNGFSGTVGLYVLNLPGNQVLPGTAFSPQSFPVPANGQATSTLTIVTNSATQTGTANLTIQGISGSTTMTASASLTVNAAAAPKTFTVSPASGPQGTAFTWTGTGLPVGDTVQQWWQYPGQSATLGGTLPVVAGGQVSWTYVSQCTDPVGSWQTWIVDTNTGWTSSHVANTVTAGASCAPSYTVSVSPSTATVTQGGSASYTVTVQSQKGFSGTVGLYVLNLPGNQVLPGTAFSPQSFPVPANGQATSTLTIVTNSATQTGTANMTIQGISGSTTVTASASLTVNAGASTPTVSNLATSPNPPVVGQQFTLTITGTNFDPVTAKIQITGPSCSPCTINNNVLTTKTATTIAGPVTLYNPGSFSVSIENTGSGSQSNSLPLSIGTSAPPAGTLKASPSACQVTTVGGTCSVSLVWTLQNTSSGLLTAADTQGNQKTVGPVSGSSGSQPISWIPAPPAQWTFYLWDDTGGKQGSQLGNVVVSASGPSAPAGSPSVGVQPSRGAPGTSFTITGSSLAPGPATVWIQAPNIPGRSVAQVTVGSDGTLTYAYATQSSSTPGSYAAWAVDSSGKQASSAPFTLGQQTSSNIPTCQSGYSNSACPNDPINAATGNYTYQRTDLTVPGRGLPFAFTRTYNSQDGTPGPIGAGWTHSYMASLVHNSDSSITIRTPDGQVVVFDPVGNTYISRYNRVYSTLQSPAPSTYVLTTKSQMSYQFASGQLTSISDRNGNAIQLTYSGSNLTGITDTAGRQYSLQYGASGHLTSLTDPLNRTLQFGYDNAGNLTTFTDANGGTFTYTYDGLHEMLTAIDPAGNTFLTNTYDDLGHVTSQADGMGNRWTYSYDANTLITTITDPNGKASSVQHDANFNLLRATDTFGKLDFYQYDSLDNRVSVQDRNGHTTALSYDQNGNVISATDAQANVQAAAYDAQSNPLTRTDALGNQTTFSYDSRGNLTASVDPLGNKTAYTYNSYGQIASRTDALGRVTQYSYDTGGNLTQVTDPLGKKTTYTYDSVGRRTSTTDANGYTTSTAYDANGNVVSVTDALGNKTQYSYDGNSNRTRATDARGKTTTYTYDGNQKLLTTADALGNKVTNTYDKLRNLASVTDQRGNVTRYSYDSENRRTAATDALGNTTSYAYDAAGNRVKVTDGLGNATTYGYDSLNRQVSITDALGNKSTTAYDAAGHVLKRTDAAGNATSYVYDGLGRQASVTDAVGGQVGFQYDKVGNRAQITDARGKVTQFAYDGMSRLLTTTDPLGNATQNQYDGVGNLIQVTDGNGNSKAYQYDANRRQTKVTYSTGGSVQFTYDVDGNRTKMVDLIGTSTYSYDDLNRLQSYNSPAGAALAFSYDAASNRTALQYPGSKSVQYTYDADNRISKVTDWNSLAVSYSYDAAGRISGASYSSGLASQYTYDPVGQSLNIQHSSGGMTLYSEATTWSANGNPTSSNISGLTAPGLASENTAYAYNDASELVSSTYGATVSDKNGNVTSQAGSGGPTAFTYDLNNRATSISGSSVSATMKYFGDGKLAELDSAGAAHRYLMDPAASGNRILAELDATGAMQIGYVYGPRGMVSQISGAQTYTYLHNLQGSTVALVDSTGAIKNSYRYDPFGGKLPSSSEQVGNSFAFLGSFSVPTVGQYSLMTFRVYDPRLGRFAQLDPARWSLLWTESPYLYSRQSPLGLVDPSGLFWSRLWSATTGTVKSLPSFVECGGSFFRDVSACQEQGFSDNMIKAGQITLNIVGAGTGTGPVLTVVDAGNDLIDAVAKSEVGLYTPGDAAHVVVSVGADVVFWQTGFDDYAEGIATGGTVKVIGRVAASSFTDAIQEFAASSASGLTNLNSQRSQAPESSVTSPSASALTPPSATAVQPRGPK